MAAIHLADDGQQTWPGCEANPPGQPAPCFGNRVAHHTKGDRYGTKAERPNIRIVNKSEFTVLETMDVVADALFGCSVTKA